jgi:protein translocase SecG subunit
MAPAVLPYIQIIASAILITAILLQRSGAGMGGALGSSQNFSATFHTRRGFEKTLFIATIVLAVIFALSALVAIIF